MEKRNWKILYSDYSGMEKKAVELVSREMGSYILRDKGVYAIHVLACEQADAVPADKNVIILGTYDESAPVRRFIRREEIPADGYVVKVFDHPENAALKIAVITGLAKREVFYGAVDFVDDYIDLAIPRCGSLYLPNRTFTAKAPDYYHASAPQIKTRSVFTWGNPINDYRDYIDNMARLRLNQLILWNDYAPINARDIIEYAHSYDIQVIWGYAWGWGHEEATLKDPVAMGHSVFEKFEKEYAPLDVDGIYFQSFTETKDADRGGKLIAEAVTDFVNETAALFYAKYPDLFIQFGLHATSVKDHLEYIGKVDDRIEILWEDCGAFPYNYEAHLLSEEEYHETYTFTDAILDLRENGGVGMLYKGQMICDWTEGVFAHQSGPFVLGCSSQEIIEHDRELVTQSWRYYQYQWMQNGKLVYDMTRHIAAKKRDKVNVGMAGMFAGGIWFSEALCAQILWGCDRPYDELFDKVARRRCVRKV